MGVTRDTARRTFGGKQYLIDTDPGAVIYRNGTSTTNLAMKVWADTKATSATGAVTFTIPTGLFTAIHFIDISIMRDTADPAFGTFAMLRSYTLTSVVGQCFESKTSGVLLGGVIEGLEVATSSLIAMVRVMGI